MLEDEPRLILNALGDIRVGTELLFDYGERLIFPIFFFICDVTFNREFIFQRQRKPESSPLAASVAAFSTSHVSQK